MDNLTQLGRYQLLRVLGTGAMGVVYEGLDPKLNRQVAVKTILQSFAHDPALRAAYAARFEREAQAVARLSHAHIVSIHDFGEENGVLYIVMEFIQGVELKELFDRQQSFALADIVRMTCELLDALDYAHQNGIIHRDIKPANLLIDQQMHVQLTDFGVARLVDSGADRTQVGTMVGTPSYMSPEQIAGHAVGPRSDLFAVGIILYQFLTGERPFQAEGTFAIQQKIMFETPAIPSTLNTALGNGFDAVVLCALAKRPEERYVSARAFKEDLLRVFAGVCLQGAVPAPVPAVPVPASAAFASALVPAAAPAPVSVSTSPASPPVSTSPAPLPSADDTTRIMPAAAPELLPNAPAAQNSAAPPKSRAAWVLGLLFALPFVVSAGVALFHLTERWDYSGDQVRWLDLVAVMASVCCAATTVWLGNSVRRHYLLGRKQIGWHVFRLTLAGTCSYWLYNFLSVYFNLWPMELDWNTTLYFLESFAKIAGLSVGLAFPYFLLLFYLVRWRIKKAMVRLGQ
jgi:serine/threonine-protein kinase